MMTRFTIKVIPVEGTCEAQMSSVLILANKILPQYFHPPNPSCTFSIQIKKRLATGFPKDKCTSELVKFINHENYPCHKNPQKVVSVQVWKNNVGLAVYSTEDFKHGFNMRLLNSNKTNDPKSNPTLKKEVKTNVESTSKNQNETPQEPQTEKIILTESNETTQNSVVGSGEKKDVNSTPNESSPHEVKEEKETDKKSEESDDDFAIFSKK